jgi:hypothetical protein
MGSLFSLATRTGQRAGAWSSRILPVVLLSAAMLVFGDVGAIMVAGSTVGPAEARIGRPLTPMSYAGVARRTTRRVVRRHVY